VLDLIGYVAATTHRGIRHVRVPTTVLAQNDSGVGVKNGVNAFGMKNLLGTFAPPFAVLNDIEFLTALEPRDKIAGMAEAVKVALIRDAVFFGWLEAHAEELVTFQPQALAYLIRRCAELHMRQIAHGGDPFETGSARPLDYGHWAAHKLEVLTHHALRHGEAVAIGLALDSRYSVQVGMLAAGHELRICSLLEKLGFRLWHPLLEKRNEDGTFALLSGLREFREHLGGELTITLLRDIGIGEEVHEMHEGEIRKSIAWLKHRLEHR
jgi:3-dehydroquinate synthase